ncbi:effector-associated constant component EACC1 [Streptomyces glaucescens]|uniref:Uncharacterized protein n=1 Tax=Streptomyces glaucescens TaxID=1907 RepID=A0A089X5W3_STRGA|nr:hypothetical protein [Streptomyces glaucescens]AIR96419.1 hypothetical protein SGLAU_01955 [Streptomyces glaucescens]
MRILVTVRGDDAGADERGHDLRRWLIAEPELRGRIRTADGAPPPGAPGAVTDALVAMLEPGRIAEVFAAVVVAWAQSRQGNQTVTITRPDGAETTVGTARVKGLDPRRRAELARRLTAVVDTAPAPARTRPVDRGAEPRRHP